MRRWPRSLQFCSVLRSCIPPRLQAARAAQMSFLASIFFPPSRRASPASQYSPHLQSAPDIRAPPGACPRFAARPLAPLRRAPVHMPLTALQQGYQSATLSYAESFVPLIVIQQAHFFPLPPLAHFQGTQPVSLDQLGPPMSNVSSPNGAVSPHSDLLTRTARASPAISSICSSSCTTLAERATCCEHCGGAGWSAARHHIRATRASVVSKAVLNYAHTARASPAQGCAYADSY